MPDLTLCAGPTFLDRLDPADDRFVDAEVRPSDLVPHDMAALCRGGELIGVYRLPAPADTRHVTLNP